MYQNSGLPYNNEKNKKKNPTFSTLHLIFFIFLKKGCHLLLYEMVS